MSFIGDSRETINSSWHYYVCLTKEDCMMIQKAVDKIVERRQKKYEKYRDIHDWGEMTSRQQTNMMLAEEELDRARALQSDLLKYLNYLK